MGTCVMWLVYTQVDTPYLDVVNGNVMLLGTRKSDTSWERLKPLDLRQFVPLKKKDLNCTLCSKTMNP